MESEFEHCLSIAMRAESADLTIVRWAQFRRGGLPAGGGFQDTAEALLAQLKEDSFRRTLAALKLRYVLVVSGGTTKGPGRAQLAGPDLRSGLWGIGGEWERHSFVTATVIDVAEVRHAGALTASSRGKEGFVVPVFLILPLPPVPFSTPTESEACNALGKAVAGFFAHKD